MNGERTTATTRFWKKVEIHVDGCWCWTGHITPTPWGAYGLFGLYVGVGLPHRRVRAHRFAYEALVGPIADGLVLDHLCRNTLCVNPEHLEPCSDRENILRGSSLTAKNATKTHCRRGHVLDEANTYIQRTGGKEARQCRECHAIREREYRRRNTGAGRAA